jgi:hypothetical protein
MFHHIGFQDTGGGRPAALADRLERTMRVTRWPLFIIGLVVSLAGHALATEHHRRGDPGSAATDHAEAVIAGDYFGAGATAGPQTAIEGDAFMTGGEVNLRLPVQGDAILSGGNIVVRERVGSDMYAAGGIVEVDAAVGHNARLAGGRVYLTPRAVIAGKLTIAGSNVRMEGRVGGALIVFGDSVVVDGNVDGGVAVVARELIVGPKTRINGRLTFRTMGPPQISPLAVITGGSRQSDFEFPGKRLEPFARTAMWVGAATFSAGLFLLGVLLVALAPCATTSVVRQLRSRPLASFLLGFALVVSIPIAAVLAMVTVIGIPLGFVLLFLWPVVIVLGYLIGVIFLGDSLGSLFGPAGAHGARRGLRVLGLAIVLIALMILSRLVLIGVLVVLLILFLGTGALLIGIRNAAR